MDDPRPLSGVRVLVPPGRPEANPVLSMLARAGADALEFPRLAAGPPSHWDRMDAAIRGLPSFDWVVFSGRDCVESFFDRGALLREPLPPAVPVRIVAIGHGAVAALKRRGVRPDLVPTKHTPPVVSSEIPALDGAEVLLVRVEGATNALPAALSARGAKVSEATGYRMEVIAESEARADVFGRPLDALALSSATAIRFLAEGLERIGLAVEDVNVRIVAAVGESTAEVAREVGFVPDLVASGRVESFAKELTESLTA